MTDPLTTPAASGPLDDTDVAILARLRAAYDHDDPPPDGLADWVTIALSLDDIDVQMCRLTSELAAQDTRSSVDGASTITFENSAMTVMLRLEERGDGRLRLDGWLIPAVEHDVEVRTSERVLTTQADAYGRFAFDRVPRGLVHLILRSLRSRPEGRRTIVTQAVIL